MTTIKCFVCDSPRGTKPYCRKCHAAYMRSWRKTRPLTADQRLKMNARSYAHVYLKRGKIERLACVECGSPKSEMHHPDYSKPTEVVWMCRPCHLNHHNPKSDLEAFILQKKFR